MSCTFWTLAVGKWNLHCMHIVLELWIMVHNGSVLCSMYTDLLCLADSSGRKVSRMVLHCNCKGRIRNLLSCNSFGRRTILDSYCFLVWRTISRIVKSKFCKLTSFFFLVASLAVVLCTCVCPCSIFILNSYHSCCI